MGGTASYDVIPARGSRAFSSAEKRRLAKSRNDLLPDEIWEIIFSYLDFKSLCAAAATCRQLSRISWSAVVLERVKTRFSDDAVRYLFSKLPRV